MAREEQGRKQRVPLGVPRAKLAVSERQGYVRRWVNDERDGRVIRAQQGGYEFVNDPSLQIGAPDIGNENRDLGSRVARVVGKHDDGTPKYAYLMEIRKDFYEADQAEKQKPLDELERSIRRGEHENRTPADRRYVPSDGISIKDS